MAWWRAYIDKKDGNEHARVYDWEEDTPNPERPLEGPELPASAKLKNSEVVGQIVSIGDPR